MTWPVAWFEALKPADVRQQGRINAAVKAGVINQYSSRSLAILGQVSPSRFSAIG